MEQDRAKWVWEPDHLIFEKVDEQFRCPACREGRVDFLVIDPDTEEVTCTTCGATYDPLAEQE